MKKTAYNPYGFQDKRGFLKGMRYAVWGGIALSLALFFLVYQPLYANSAPAWLTTTVFYLTEGISTAALFATLALLILTVAREESALRKKLFVEETLALALLSVVLRMLLYLLTAAIDSANVLGFYLNDVTLSYLTDAYGFNFFMRTLSALIGILMMLAVLFLSSLFLRRRYRKLTRGKVDQSLKNIPTLVYLAVSVTFAVIDTVMTVIDIGFAFEFSVIFSLLLPYIEIAVYTLIGRFIIDEVIAHFETK